MKAGSIRVQAFPQLLAGLKERHRLRLDGNSLSRAGIATGARVTRLYGKSAKSAQFNPVTLGQSLRHLVEYGRHNPFHIPLKQSPTLSDTGD
jgi:hypothetical protein|tara:strand:+ start:9995 stop:10270 length:276 start_codon:yes stop_codon:yes gene_type:complete